MYTCSIRKSLSVYFGFIGWTTFLWSFGFSCHAATPLFYESNTTAATACLPRLIYLVCCILAEVAVEPATHDVVAFISKPSCPEVAYVYVDLTVAAVISRRAGALAVNVCPCFANLYLAHESQVSAFVTVGGPLLFDFWLYSSRLESKKDADTGSTV